MLTSSSVETLCYLLGLLLPPVALRRLYRWYRLLTKNNQLAGKVVLVTGASSGIGKELARKMHLAGARVILASRNRDKLEEVKQEMVKEGRRGLEEPQVLTVDLEQVDTLGEKAGEAEEVWGQIDIVVNNLSCTNTHCNVWF